MKVIEGWEGKAMGLLQTLWERGFVDDINLPTYAVNFMQDESGILLKDTSLIYFMINCHDFQERESLLQIMGQEIGIIVDHIPKCHWKFFKEGLLRIQSKKGRENLKEAVKHYIKGPTNNSSQRNLWSNSIPITAQLTLTVAFAK